MNTHFGGRVLRHLLGFFLVLVSLGAMADPPTRVARISYVTGAASFSVGGEPDWARAVVNRPLITGDKLWVDRGARAELQMGSAAIRVGSSTSLALLNLDDRTTQIQLTQGLLNLRVRRLDRGEVFEIATPNLAYSIRQPGNYRVEVDPQGDSTMVLVRSGSAQVYGEGRAFVIGANRSYRFYDTDLRDFETFAVRGPDEFDRWSTDRDRRWDASPSRRFVSADMIGYSDPVTLILQYIKPRAFVQLRNFTEFFPIAVTQPVFDPISRRFFLGGGFCAFETAVIKSVKPIVVDYVSMISIAVRFARARRLT